MKDRDLKGKIRRAVEHATPDKLEAVLQSCQGEKPGILELVPKAPRHRGVKRFVAAAAAFILVLGTALGALAYQNAHKTFATISLDVNPSLQLEVSKKEKVLDIKALNSDAEKVLEGMELKDTDLTVAVNAIIGSMLQNGYLSVDANSVLLSVQGDGSAKLEKQLMGEIDSILRQNSIEGAILAQSVQADAALEEQAKANGISLGKARLVKALCEQNPLLRFEELAKMTINDLNLLAASRNLKPGDAVQSGTASDGKYIGEAKAKALALAHLGTAESAVARLKAELDVEDGRLVYEVEWTTGTEEIEVEVDAATGQIIKVERDDKNDAEDAPDKGEAHEPVDEEDKEDEGQDDKDEAPPIPPATDIGADQAKAIALGRMQLQAGDVKKLTAKLEWENGKVIYEVEFKTDTEEFEVEVDAATGQVIKAKREPADD